MSGNVIQLGRVRKLNLDFTKEWCRFPLRGDRLWSGTTLYFVLHARRVQRRTVDAGVRIDMRVMRVQDMEPGLSGRLMRSACRRDGSYRFEFAWNPRKRKTRSFEQLMRRKSGE